ncbi:MAG: hypothetical protein ABL918_02860 [Chakrabartia sp.]
MMKKSILRFGAALSAVLLATIAVPASATKWMIIGAEPDPAPHRSVYIMSGEKEWVTKRIADGYDIESTSGSRNAIADLQANTINTVIVQQVFENAGGTNFISYTLDFKCQAGLVSIARAQSYDRAGKGDVRTSTEWMKIPNNWMGKAEMIACDWKSWQSARRVWGGGEAPPSKRKKKDQEPASSFASLGMEYLGEANIMRVTDAIDLVWKTRWTDAVQPAYYEGTAKEKAEAAAKLAEMQGKIKTVLQDAKKNVEDDIAMQDKIDKKLGQVGQKFFREMQGIGGKSEDHVVSLFGIPQGLVETTPGVRQLNYYWSDTETIQVPYTVDIIGSIGNGVMGKVGETTNYRPETRTIQCYRKLFLKEGGQLPGYRVFDFDIGCS